jgi:hypothetical protein
MNELQQQRAKLEGLVDTQIDPVSGLAINCRNCIHCDKSSFGSGFDKCMKSGGRYCNLIHQFPRLHGNICYNYSSWSPRQKSILELLADKIRKILQ